MAGWRKALSVVLLFLVLFSLVACGSNGIAGKQDLGIRNDQTAVTQPVKGHSYSTKTEVAAYIHLYNELPPNYLTKKEAMSFGWDNTKGNLWQVTDHKSIGGDIFGNREGLLPKAKGRLYYECDINYQGGYRGAERLIYSNDGLIF